MQLQFKVSGDNDKLNFTAIFLHSAVDYDRLSLLETEAVKNYDLLFYLDPPSTLVE